MDNTILTAMIAGFATLFGTLLVLHAQNRKDAKTKAESEMLRDNRLAILLENFPPHRHRDHQGIDYPAGMHPGAR
ncbi:MAG TPA: hypothetical protein VN682_17050 [Terriglobales bacterium]|nr:hypothetical protein [Terriglobales bacterium]